MGFKTSAKVLNYFRIKKFIFKTNTINNFLFQNKSVPLLYQNNNNMKKVWAEFQRILDGAGWASIDYVQEFSELENDSDRYLLMLLLANEGKLHDDDDDDEGKGKPIPAKSLLHKSVFMEFTQR